jgi:hypothetical protein
MSAANRIEKYLRIQPSTKSARRSVRFTIYILVFALLVTGCVTDAQFLAQNSSAALRTAESRGKFELNCPEVTTAVLSQKVVEGVQGGYGRFAGAWAGPWTEYTVGVRGCGREAVYVTVCRDPDSCNAFSQTARVLDAPQ